MWENVSTIPQDPQVPRISIERKLQVAFASFYWKFCQYTISVYSECYKSVIIILKSLVYTKTVDSVFRALWLATQSVNVLQPDSLIHLQFLRASGAKLEQCVVLRTPDLSDFNMFADAIFTNFPLERNSIRNDCLSGIIFMQTASISCIEELSSMAIRLQQQPTFYVKKQVSLRFKSILLDIRKLINNYSLKSRWIVAKYLPSRESGEVNIPKATIHRDWEE